MVSNRRDTARRREQIVSLLREQGSVKVEVLADLFGVSTQTLRKDLNFLDSQRICVRSTGGAKLTTAVVATVGQPVHRLRSPQTEEQVSIGRRAAALISPGDSILVNRGGTTLQLARHLDSADSVVVVTNNVPILNELIGRENVQLVFLGGTLQDRTQSFYGHQTELGLQDLHVDKLILSADGWDIEKGVTTHDESEAVLNRLMCKAAAEVVLLAEAAKFGRICLHKVIDMQRVSKLITDSEPPTPVREALTSAGVEVIVA